MLTNPYDAKPGDKYAIRFKKELITITFGDDGFWRDPTGCIWSFNDKAKSVDDDVRLGVGVFSMPKNFDLNDCAIFHDNAYTNPGYQKYHFRKEADTILKEQLESKAKGIDKIFVAPFYFLSRLFGSLFWENDSTNN